VFFLLNIDYRQIKSTQCNALIKQGKVYCNGHTKKKPSCQDEKNSVSLPKYVGQEMKSSPKRKRSVTRENSNRLESKTN